MPYIYSTLSADNEYPLYDQAHTPGQPYTVKKSVLIRGGSGIINANGHTEQFSEQFVSDADYEVLEQNSVFKMHVANRFILVAPKQIGAKATENLSPDDGGKQLTETELEKGSARVPAKPKKLQV